jgi:uncharacterized protein (DUF433 family)
MEQIVKERIMRILGLCGGRPTIRGTRMTVQALLELIAGGMSFDEILDDHPYVEREDLQAYVAFDPARAPTDFS